MAERHPSDTALFDHAGAPVASVGAHIATCARCSERAARLASGAASIRDAHAMTAHVSDWDAIDETLAREAVRQATRVRGRERFAGWRTWMLGGAMCASAAGALVAWRVVSRRVVTGVPVAMAPVLAPRTEVAVVAPVAVPHETHETTGIVLWIASDVTVEQSGTSTPLTAASAVRAGSRLRTGGRGRVVVSIGGARVDVRAGSTVAMREGEGGGMVFALERGSVRIDEGTSTAKLEANGWTIASKPGAAIVAKLGADGATDLRVLAGEADVAGGAGVTGHARAGDDVALGHDRLETTRSREGTDDALAVPTSWLAADGNAHALASSGDGVRFARLAAAVDPSDARVASWLDHSLAHRAIAARARRNDAPSEALAAPVAPPPALPVARPIADAPVTQSTLASASRWLSARSEWCFASCVSTSACVASSGAWVAVDTNSDGTVSDARVEGLGHGTVASCVRHEALSLHVSPSLAAQTYQLAIDVGDR